MQVHSKFWLYWNNFVVTLSFTNNLTDVGWIVKKSGKRWTKAVRVAHSTRDKQWIAWLGPQAQKETREKKIDSIRCGLRDEKKKWKRKKKKKKNNQCCWWNFFFHNTTSPRFRLHLHRAQMNSQTPVECCNNTSVLLWDIFKMTIQDAAPRRFS